MGRVREHGAALRDRVVSHMLLCHSRVAGIGLHHFSLTVWGIFATPAETQNSKSEDSSKRNHTTNSATCYGTYIGLAARRRRVC